MKYTFLFFFNFLIFILLSCSIKTHAQTAAIDSLSNLAKKSGEDSVKVNVLNQLAYAVLFEGDYEPSLKYSTEAKALAEKLNYKKGIAVSEIRIANYYYFKSNYPESLTHFFKALKICEDNKYKKYIAYILNFIGNINTEQNEHDKGLSSFLKAVKIEKEINDQKGLADSYGNIGNLYFSIGKLTEASDYFSRSLRIFEEMKFKYGIALCLGDLGRVYYANGDYKRSIDYEQKSLALSEEVGDPQLLLRAHENLGKAYLQEKNYRLALFHANKSLQLCKEIDDPDLLKDVEETLSQIYEKMGDGPNALLHYKAFIAARDTVFNNANTEKLVRSEMNFDFDKKQAVAKAEQEKKDALQKEEVRRQRSVRNGLIAGFILTLLLAVVIFKSYRQKQKANELLTSQKREILEKNKELVEQKKEIEEQKQEISQSINYARRIQRSFLTSEAYISRLLKDYFILYKPRDIVSGDFYWIAEKGNYLYTCTADCTGHGIPGAFMSLIGMGILNEIIFSKSHLNNTDEILNELRRIVIHATNPEGSTEKGQDGMDLVLCRYDFHKMELEYSAANNPFYIVRKGELMEFKPDKMPVGKYILEEKPFTKNTIKLEKGDCVYTFSDGYADQFGGLKGKKFMYRQLEAILLQNAELPMHEQEQMLEDAMEKWKQNYEQVDDILVMGIRI